MRWPEVAMWRVWLLLVTLLGAAGAQEGKVGPQKKPSPQNAPSGAPPGAKNPCESPVLDVTPKPPPVSIDKIYEKKNHVHDIHGQREKIGKAPTTSWKEPFQRLN